MFWADNFTSSEYVGFSDTDAIFTTYVDREDLFEHSKPVINGMVGPMNGYHEVCKLFGFQFVCCA